MKAVDVEPGATVGRRDAGWRSVGRVAAIMDEYFEGDELTFVVGVFDGAQNRIKRNMWFCSICGFNPSNRGNWCDSGCGRDYNLMLEVLGSNDEEYCCGYEYGRYSLCFENPTLFLAITKEGPEKVTAPLDELTAQTIAKIPPKVKRVRYNIFGEPEEEDDDDDD